MRSPEIDHKIVEIQDLMKIWMHFYKILAAGFSPETISEQREREFLDIKTTVAERHEDFMRILEELKAQEDLYIGQNILSLVKRTISLREFSKLSGVEINKISIEWHDANIMLNECLGSLEYKRDQIAKVSEFDFKMKKYKRAFTKTVTDIVTSPKVKVFVILIIFVAAGVAIYMNWAKIEKNPIYTQYLEQYLAPILKMIRPK